MKRKIVPLSLLLVFLSSFGFICKINSVAETIEDETYFTSGMLIDDVKTNKFK